MPDFGTMPLPEQVTALRKQVETKVVSVWDSATATKAGGSQGVVTRERHYPQAEEEVHRDYGLNSEVPALWAAVRTGARGIADETNMWELEVPITIDCVTSKANARDAVGDNLDLMEIAAETIFLDIWANQSGWIAGVDSYADGWSAEDIVMHPGSATCARSTLTITARFQWERHIVGA